MDIKETQKKVLESVAKYLCDEKDCGSCYGDWEDLEEDEEEEYLQYAAEILKALAALGVRIVDEDAKLPENPYIASSAGCGFTFALQAMAEKGWSGKVYPLEVSDDTG